MVVEALQLLHHVVQLEDRPERLAVGAVGRRRVELQDGVVLTQSLLDELREKKKNIQSRLDHSISFPPMPTIIKQ